VKNPLTDETGLANAMVIAPESSETTVTPECGGKSNSFSDPAHRSRDERGRILERQPGELGGDALEVAEAFEIQGDGSSGLTTGKDSYRQQAQNERLHMQGPFIAKNLSYRSTFRTTLHLSTLTTG
jgi:hypothetical protein